MVFDSQRRELLKYGGVGAATLLAGCSGGDGGSGDGSSDGGDGSSGDGGDGNSGDGGSGGTTAQQMADEVVMYGIDKFETRAIGKSFKEKYGTSISTTVLLGGENSTRYVQEHNNGKDLADVVQGFVENNNALIHAEDDLIADAEIPNWDKVTSQDYIDYLAKLYDDREAAKLTVPLGGIIGGTFAYNKSLVDEPPKTWDDLLDDRFKGELIMLNYNVSGVWDHYERQYGEEKADDFLVALDNQNPTYIGGSPVAAVQKVGAGQAKVAPDSFLTHIAMLQQKGLPLGWSWPEFMWRQHWSLMLLEHAPHFETAKTFCQYSTSKEGQKAFSQIFGGVDPAHEDLPHGNPKAAEKIQNYDGTIRPQGQTNEREKYCDQKVEELIGI